VHRRRFWEHFFFPDATANILSLSLVAKLYKIVYNQRHSTFFVEVPGYKKDAFAFREAHGGLNVCDFSFLFDEEERMLRSSYKEKRDYAYKSTSTSYKKHKVQDHENVVESHSMISGGEYTNYKNDDITYRVNTPVTPCKNGSKASQGLGTVQNHGKLKTVKSSGSAPEASRSKTERIHPTISGTLTSNSYEDTSDDQASVSRSEVMLLSCKPRVLTHIDDDSCERTDHSSLDISSDSTGLSHGLNESRRVTHSAKKELYHKAQPFGDEMVERHKHVSYMASVRENLANYNSAERRRAHAAKRLLVRLAHAPPQAAMKILRQGGMMNCPITSQDIARATKIWGLRSIPSLKGRGVRTKGYDTIGLEPGLKRGSIPEKMYTDVMYSVGQAFLLSVWLPVNLLAVSHLSAVKASGRKKPTQGEIRTAIESQLNKLEKTSLKTIECHCDGEIGAEGSESRLALDRRDIPTYTCAANEHVPEIERRVKQSRNAPEQSYAIYYIHCQRAY
jgi:hypothetical protein